MDKIKKLYFKYEELINYLWVGILTTIVSWSAKFIAAIWLDANIKWQNILLSTISWTAGVIFGYFANRKWVFKSKDPHIIKEFTKFAGSRLSTWLLDIVINLIVVNVIGEFLIYPKIGAETIVIDAFGVSMTCSKATMVVATLISAVLVTIANYVFSKLFVFKKKKVKDSDADTQNEDESTKS